MACTTTESLIASLFPRGCLWRRGRRRKWLLVRTYPSPADAFAALFTAQEARGGDWWAGREGVDPDTDEDDE